MTARRIVAGLLQQDRLNFVLTNRIPRRLLTRLVGWLSRIEQPLIRDLSIGIWGLFATIDLADTENRRFRSMHDCFTRALRPGARPIDADPEALVSPCDAIVGACGRIGGTTVVQAKGFPYTLDELLLDPGLADRYRDGSYVTLRLTSGMYHRFHAPQTGKVEKVTYVAGDTWNVNASALRRIDKLFCKNERALIEMRLDGSGYRIVLVPVAAVLVASIRLHCVDVTLHLGRHGPNVIPCAAAVRKGEEMGWFEHGSTIIVIAPSGFELFPAVSAGQHIRMGESLLRMPPSAAGSGDAQATTVH